MTTTIDIEHFKKCLHYCADLGDALAGYDTEGDVFGDYNYLF